MVPISQLDDEPIDKIEDIYKLGDELAAMVTSIDIFGNVRLSRRAVLEGWMAGEAISCGE